MKIEFRWLVDLAQGKSLQYREMRLDIYDTLNPDDVESNINWSDWKTVPIKYTQLSLEKTL